MQAESNKLSQFAWVKKATYLILLSCLNTLGQGCATTENPETPMVWEEKFEFTGWNDALAPYPLEGFVYREWWLNGHKQQSELAFVVWDINRDGIADMADTVNQQGQASERNFDFDFDGKADFSLRPTEN